VTRKRRRLMVDRQSSGVTMPQFIPEECQP
jgi:hypothetical protein